MEFETIESFLERTAPVSWIVPGILPERALAVLYGPPGAGKTFVSLDMALCLASGRSWPDGIPDEAARPVLYWLGEGATSFGERVAGLSAARGIAPGERAALAIHTGQTGGIAGKPASIDRAVAAVRAMHTRYGRAPLMVIDTLAATHPGLDENDGIAVAALLGACRRVVDEGDATVLIVHHTGKIRGRGARGHSRLTADPDLVLALSAVGQGPRRIRLATEKQRMGIAAPPLLFTLEAREGAGAMLRHAPSAASATPGGGKTLTKTEREFLAVARATQDDNRKKHGRDDFLVSEMLGSFRFSRSTAYAIGAALERAGHLEPTVGKRLRISRPRAVSSAAAAGSDKSA